MKNRFVGVRVVYNAQDNMVDEEVKSRQWWKPDPQEATSREIQCLPPKE